MHVLIHCILPINLCRAQAYDVVHDRPLIRCGKATTEWRACFHQSASCLAQSLNANQSDMLLTTSWSYQNWLSVCPRIPLYFRNVRKSCQLEARDLDLSAQLDGQWTGAINAVLKNYSPLWQTLPSISWHILRWLWLESQWSSHTTGEVWHLFWFD